MTTGFLCWRTGDLPRSSLEQASLYPRTTDLILSDPDTQRRLVKAPTSALPKMVGKLRYLLPPSLNCCEAFGASWQTTAFSKWQQRVSKATPNCASDPTAPPLTMKKLRQALRKIWVTAGVSPRETPPDGISISPQTASNLEVGISSSNELPRGGPRRSTSSGSEINGTSRSLRNGSRTHDLTLVPARPPPERGSRVKGSPKERGNGRSEPEARAGSVVEDCAICHANLESDIMATACAHRFAPESSMSPQFSLN